MKRGMLNECKQFKLDSNKNKPVKILGISSSYRSKYSCARENPTSLRLLKTTLKHAEKLGAKTELIDLRNLKIGLCKECYSSCPAQCRFDEKRNMCDCYPFKDTMIFENNDFMKLSDAYDNLNKKEFINLLNDPHSYIPKDDMHIVYKAMRESDAIIFSGFTNYYGRPALLQTMFSRLCALDGGVEELWGDGKNIKNSYKYARNPKNTYKQRLYGKQCAFITVSKEGDAISPNLMKACTMMGMNIIPFASAYGINWYNDRTHKSDKQKVLKDEYTNNLIKTIAKIMIDKVKRSNRKYGLYSNVV